MAILGLLSTLHLSPRILVLPLRRARGRMINLDRLEIGKWLFSVVSQIFAMSCSYALGSFARL